MELTLSIAIMLVTLSVAIIQVLRCYCNYAGGTFCYSYVGGSFCCNYAVSSFCISYEGGSFCNKYVGDTFYCNYAGEGLLQLCRWYFLQCIRHMTVSIVIMQVTVLVIAMLVTVSSNNFIFLSLTPTFHKIDWKKLTALHQVSISSLVNILPKLRYLHTNRLKELFSILVFLPGL